MLRYFGNDPKFDGEKSPTLLDTKLPHPEIFINKERETEGKSKATYYSSYINDNACENSDDFTQTCIDYTNKIINSNSDIFGITKSYNVGNSDINKYLPKNKKLKNEINTYRITYNNNYNSNYNNNLNSNTNYTTINSDNIYDGRNNLQFNNYSNENHKINNVHASDYLYKSNLSTVNKINYQFLNSMNPVFINNPITHINSDNCQYNYSNYKQTSGKQPSNFISPQNFNKNYNESININTIINPIIKNDHHSNNLNHNFNPNLNHNFNPNLNPNYNPYLNYKINSNNNFNSNLTNKSTNCDSKLMDLNFMNMDNKELAKNAVQLAKRQVSCRFLQKKIDADPEIANSLIFPSTIEYFSDLTNDYFGNYLIQKLVEHISETKLLQMLAILKLNFINHCLNQCGSRVIQKIIHYLKSDELILCFVKILKPCVLTLLKDMNGSYVIEKFVSNVDIHYSNFIYSIVIKNIYEICTDKTGCCVLKRLIDNACMETKQVIIENIISITLSLILDQYGNYIIQYIQEFNCYEYNKKIIFHCMKDIYNLTKQKYSSNVIEKSFQFCDEETKRYLIHSLMEPEILIDLIMDVYGNYVIQKLLQVVNVEERAFILSVIAPVMEKLKDLTFGSKLYSKLIIAYPEIAELMFEI